MRSPLSRAARSVGRAVCAAREGTPHAAQDAPSAERRCRVQARSRKLGDRLEEELALPTMHPPEQEGAVVQLPFILVGGLESDGLVRQERGEPEPLAGPGDVAVRPDATDLEVVGVLGPGQDIAYTSLGGCDRCD